MCVGLLVSCGSVLCLCWFLVSCGTALCLCWFVGQLWDSVVCVHVGLSELVDSFVLSAGLSELVDSVVFSVGLSELVDSSVFVLVYLNWWTVLTLVFI